MNIRQKKAPRTPHGVTVISLSISNDLLEALKDMQSMESVVEGDTLVVPGLSLLINRELREAVL